METMDYLKCRKELNELGIKDSEIKKAFKQLSIEKRDLTDEQGYSNESHKPHGVHEFLKTGIIYWDEYQGEYKKQCTRTGSIYLVPAQYQGLKHGKIIYQLLKNRYYWFDDFQKDKSYKESPLDKYLSIGRLDVEKLPEEYKNMTVNELLKLNKSKKVTKKTSAWSLYEMYGADYEMYLTTEFGSLYVPIKAILNKNFSLIEKRMKSYSLSYHDPINLSGFALNHRGRSREEYKKDKENDYKKLIKPLKSKEAKQLKELLKGGVK